MENNEKYGIELEAKYDKLKKDFSIAEKIADKFAQKIEKIKSNTSKKIAETSVGNITKSWSEMNSSDVWKETEKVRNIQPIEIDVKTAELDLARHKLTLLIEEYARLNQQGVSKASEDMLKLASDISKAKEKVDKLEQSLKALNDGNQKTSGSSLKIGNNISKGISKGMTSIRRFTLSLFGIHSIWRLISKASSEALSTNEYQTSRLSVAWNALGQIMSPIIEKLITGFQYVAIAIAKVIQLFTGYNALARTTTKNIQSTTNAVKTLSSTLGGFDELTNIETGGTGTGLASGIQNDLKALAEFQSKIKEVENFFERTGITNAINKIKEAVKILWENALKPLWETVLYPMLDFLIKNPNILATVFGIFLGTKLILGIASVIGSGLMSNPVGLLGVLAVISTIAAIGSIVITIKGIDELNKHLKTLPGVISNTTEKSSELNEELKKLIDTGELTDDQAQKIINSNMSLDGKLQSTAKALINNMSWWQKLGIQISKTDGELNDYQKSINEAIKAELIQLDKLKLLYEANYMDTEQIKRYKLGLLDEIETLIDANSYLDANTDEHRNNADMIYNNIIQLGNLYEQTGATDEQMNKYKTTVENLIRQLEIENGHLDKNSKEYQNNQQQIENLKKVADNYADGDYTAQIKTKFDSTQLDEAEQKVNGFTNTDFTCPIKVETDTSKAKSGLSKFFEGIRSFGNTVASTLFPGANISKIISKIASLDVGTNYVPSDQLAMIHKGEAVIPKKFNKEEFFNNSNNDEIVNAIHDLQQTLEQKDMNAYISKDAIGKTSVDYINQQHRLKGRSVI